MNYFNRDLPSPAKNSQFPDLRGGLVFATPDNRYVWQWDKLNIAPRLGFAWSALPKTVIRWGGGLFFAPAETSNAATALRLSVICSKSPANKNRKTRCNFWSMASPIGKRKRPAQNGKW